MSGVNGNSGGTPGAGSVTGGPGGSIATETVTGGAGGNIAAGTITSYNTSGEDLTICVARSVTCSGATLTTVYTQLTFTNGLLTAVNASPGGSCP